MVLIITTISHYCKLESKRLYNNYLQTIQNQFHTKPQSFWDFVRKRQGGNTIPEIIHLGDIKVSGYKVVDLLAKYFSSIYIKPRVIPITELSTYTVSQFSFLPSLISISAEEVHSVLDSLSTTRGSHPDNISAYFLHRCRNAITTPITCTFNKSLTEGVFPSVWKCSRVTPIFKSGSPADVTNYRPISGLPFLGNFVINL